MVSRFFRVVAIAAVVLAGTGWAAQSSGGKRPADGRRPALRAVARAESRPDAGLDPAEIDAMLEAELAKAGRSLAPIARDEDFLRRVTVDLTGSPPSPEQLDAFIADSHPDKRSRIVNELLKTDAYARNWARYWRDVIRFHAVDARSQFVAPRFEEWMTDQLKNNVHWDRIATELITAKGKTEEDGRTYLIFSQFDMENTAVNVAAEVSRVFMGIQISCAQCHDHPYDEWKREQFHEMAAFFARTLVFREPSDPRSFEVRSKDDLLRGRPGMQAAARRRGGQFALEHSMADKDDPEKMLTMHPSFLLGQKPAQGLGDVQRRELLASFITDKNDPWFARAYVNRIWGTLMGEGFYEPVDDLGPGRTARFPMIINRLSSAWRATDYDVQWLFRVIMNTEAYQREIRPRDPSADSAPFAAACPTRLSADQIFDSLVSALGIEEALGRSNNNPGMRRGPGGGARALFTREFAVDPSTPTEEVQGTVPQALFFMNSPIIAQQIDAKSNTMLGRLLAVYDNNDEVIGLLYKRVLARAPSASELATCQAYIREVGDRHEAFEDLLWSLVNSTEFITKR